MFEHFDTRVCDFGHSHFPVLFGLDSESLTTHIPTRGADTFRVRLEPSRRYLINPGSIGQPRDGDNRASFGIYDEGRRGWLNNLANNEPARKAF